MKYVKKDKRHEPKIDNERVLIRIGKDSKAKLESLTEFYGMKSASHCLDFVIQQLHEMEKDNRTLLSCWREHSGTLETARMTGILNSKTSDILKYLYYLVVSLKKQGLINNLPTEKDLIEASKELFGGK